MEGKSIANRSIILCRILIILSSVLYLSTIYLASITRREKLIWILMYGIFVACYLLAKLSIWEKSSDNRIAVKHDSVETLALLSEQGTILREWRIVNRNGLIIGKSTEDSSVDVDLSKSPDAPYISRKHAVLNFASGDWFIEDLDSRNGVRVKKPGQESVNIKGTGPVLLERGDMIFIGNTVFVLR